MPKPINWDKFTMLTQEQREEMKTFVDVYGRTVEKYFGIELNEDYVRKQIEKNNETYQKAQEFSKQTEHFDELLEQYPKPAECPNLLIFARGYRLYLTDNAEENKALQESLKTKEGQQAFVNRMVKDMMELDITQDSYLDTLDASITAANSNPRMQHLKFLSVNLKGATEKQFPLDEPLKTAFEDKCKLIEFCDTCTAPTMLSATPMGLLLPMERSKNDIKLTEQLIKKHPGAPKLFEYTNCINSAALDDEFAERTPAFNQMKEKGWLNNDVRIKDSNGKYINKGDVLVGLKEGKKYTAEKLSPEASESLAEQFENMPVYSTNKEKAAARERLNVQLDNLKKSGFEVKEADLIAVSKNKETRLVFAVDDIYPRKLEYDRNTQQFKVGGLIKGRPKEPKKPNAFKQFLHGISSGFFKSEFDKYEKDMREYSSLRQAYEEVAIEAEERWERGMEAKENFREKQNEGFSKQMDAERNFERPVEYRGVINGNPEGKGINPDKFDALYRRVTEQQMIIGDMPNGALRDFGMVVNGRHLVNLMNLSNAKENLTGQMLDDVQTGMANECVFNMVQLEHANLGDKAPGPLEQRLNKEMVKRRDDEIIPMVKEVKSNPTFKHLTDTMTIDHAADFLLNQGAHKLNVAMAKAGQPQKQNSDNGKQLQSDKKLDNKQPVLTDPNHRVPGAQNVLGK